MKRHPPPGSTQRARRLRRELTEVERRFWPLLREAFPDARFRRQVPIRQYIADFVSHRHKLVLEFDGGQHSAEIDAPRTAAIEADGYRMLRFWNNHALQNPRGVLDSIAIAIGEQGECGGRRNRRKPQDPPP